jgi:hypothetical protein
VGLIGKALKNAEGALCVVKLINDGPMLNERKAVSPCAGADLQHAFPPNIGYAGQVAEDAIRIRIHTRDLLLLLPKRFPVLSP